MKTSIVCFIVFVMSGYLCRGSDEELIALTDRLKLVITEHFPEQNIEYISKTDQITVSLNTMPYQIHSIGKDGKIAFQAHEEIGPRADGFIIVLTPQQGQYRGAAALPQTFNRPYWKSFGNAIFTDSGDSHIHAEFSYGIGIPPVAIAKIVEALK